MQAVATDPDNSTDAQGSALPFLYSWTGLGPAGLHLSGAALAALYLPSALQFGQLTFAAGSMQVGVLGVHLKNLASMDSWLPAGEAALSVVSSGEPALALYSLTHFSVIQDGPPNWLGPVQLC